MSDYDSENEEARSEDSNEEREGYAESISESVEELEDHYNDLLLEKYRLVLSFNNGGIDTKSYHINMARINRDLNETEFNERTVEQNIIEKEINLKGLLDNLESKLKGYVDTKDAFQQPKLLTSEELQEVKQIKYELDELYNKHRVIEEDDEPLVSNRVLNEWNRLNVKEKVKMELLTGLRYPDVSEFKNKVDFEKAEDTFIDNIGIFMESFWDPYEQSEEKELLTIAKNRKFKVPPKGTKEYADFLEYIRTLIPYGFVHRTGIRKIGDVYEKVEFKTMKEKLNELQILQKELPIKLTAEEQKYSDKLNEYIILLNKLSEEELRTCISNTTLLKPTAMPFPTAEKELLTFAKKLKLEIPPKGTPEYSKFLDYIGTKKYYQADLRRDKSKRQLEKALKDVPIGLTRFIKENGEVVDNIVYKIDLLENYIYKITKDNKQAYYSKIKDIIFIFEHYPEFKIKFLQGGIDIIQLALFENVLRQEQETTVYPASVNKRKETIRKILQEIYINTYDIPRFRKSEILTKVILTKRSKELERFIFDSAENKRDYILKLKQITDFIKKRKQDILIIKLEDIILTKQPKEKIVDYASMDYKQIHTLLLQEQYHLQDLENKKRMIQAKNYNDVYAIFWVPPPIIPPEQRKTWNDLLEKVKTSPKPMIYINDLNKLHFYLIKQYKLDFIPGLPELNKSITQTSEKIEILEQNRVRVEREQMEYYRKNYLSVLQKRYGQLPPKIYVKPPTLFYPKVDELIIGELVNLVKRTLMKADINMELYDMNELNNKMTLTKKEGHTAYSKIQTYLKSSLGPELNNKRFLEKAILKVAEIMEIPIEITSYPNAIKELTKKWKKEFHGEIFMSLYDENVFEKLLTVTSPFDFYNVLGEYTALLQRFTPPDKPIYTKPRTTFNGQVYDVEFLDKDWGTGQPLKTYKREMVKNPRTQMFEIVDKISVRKGKFPFIKRTLRTEQEGVIKEIWQEIKPGLVRYQILNSPEWVVKQSPAKQPGPVQIMVKPRSSFGKSKINNSKIKYKLNDSLKKQKKKHTPAAFKRKTKKCKKM